MIAGTEVREAAREGGGSGGAREAGMEEKTRRRLLPASIEEASLGARLGVATSPEWLVIPESWTGCWNDPLETVWRRLEAGV